MWQSLLANLAVMAIMLIAWNGVAERIEALPRRTRSLLFGLVMAVGTLASMAMAFQVAPGVFFDLRNPAITIAALFGGVPAAVITAGSALAYRTYLGGAVPQAAVGIVLAFGIGLVVRRFSPANRVCLTCVGVAAAATSSLIVPIILAMPVDGWRPGIEPLAIHVGISFAAAMLLGMVLFHEEQRRALSQTNRQFRAMVDALPDCLNLKDGDGRFVAANPATARLMGVPSVADLIGRTDADFYPPELASRYREDERAVLAARMAVSIEQPARLATGEPGWITTLKAPVFDHSGALLGLITSNRDITERKALQDELARTQSHFDQALRNMSDGLALYDSTGILLFANDRYRALFPATAHLRVPGASLAEIITASIAAGEEALPKDTTLPDLIRTRLDHLARTGEYVIDKPDGSIYAARTKVLDNGDSLRIIADITERARHEQRLEHQALHDPLTGLPNRAFFNREIERRLKAAGSHDQDLLVMLLDLDRFKQVNDNFGHAAGDALLIEVARRLKGAARPDDFIARLGGDEFAILVAGARNAIDEAGVSNRILKALGRPMPLGDVTLLPSGTLGYTVWPRDRSDQDGLLKHADAALYAAKARGRGTWAAFDDLPAFPEKVRA